MSVIRGQIAPEFERLNTNLNQCRASIDSLVQRDEAPEASKMAPDLDQIRSDLKEMISLQAACQSRISESNKMAQTERSQCLTQILRKLDKFNQIEEMIQGTMDSVKSIENAMNEQVRHTLAIIDRLKQSEHELDFFKSKARRG